jgi:hypothetical protein
LANIVERLYIAVQRLNAFAVLFALNLERADAASVPILTRLFAHNGKRFSVIAALFGVSLERADALVAILAQVFPATGIRLRSRFVYMRRTVPAIIVLMVFFHYYLVICLTAKKFDRCGLYIC